MQSTVAASSSSGHAEVDSEIVRCVFACPACGVSRTIRIAMEKEAHWPDRDAVLRARREEPQEVSSGQALPKDDGGAGWRELFKKEKDKAPASYYESQAERNKQSGGGDAEPESGGGNYGDCHRCELQGVRSRNGRFLCRPCEAELWELLPRWGYYPDFDAKQWIGVESWKKRD